jgi:hypothetical protein
MEPIIFLSAMLITDRYYFMATQKIEFDFTTGRGSIRTMMYDKQDNALFNYTIYNSDYTDKKMHLYGRHLNHEIAICQRLEAFRLVEDNEKGLLKGQLKEIASAMNEESNPVIMLIKHRK